MILKDIASALSYLHTGANQVVLHRDKKASNVMLDFNGRLGDFGMARFEDYGDSLPATAAIGTMGHMAPELTTVGTSTRTNVYAFGAFMLEVTCGRRPLDHKIPAEKMHLIKWVCDCCRSDYLLDAIDIRMGLEYSEEGIDMTVLLEAAFTSRSSLSPSASLPSPHNSMFVSHTITYGDGR